MRDDAAIAEQALTIATAVREACAAQEWSEAVTLVDKNWALLLDERRDDLDYAIRAIPFRAFSGYPGAAAVRDLRMHTSADAVERMLGRAPAVPEAHDEAALEELARSENALTILSIATSRMIAYRVRGQFQRARGLARLVERLARVSDVHQPALVHHRVPSALLQAAIVRGLADDVDAGLITFQDAYEHAPAARERHIAQDAAGKLALFAAIKGDFDIATRWLERHDASPAAGGWQRSRVGFTADAARCLIAIEKLDRHAADETIGGLEQPANSEHSWAPLLTFVVARHALIWGDRLRALELIEQAWKRFGAWLGEDSTFAPLLRHAEIQLLLSVRRHYRARQIAGDSGARGLAVVSKAHVALLEGNFEAAAQLSAKAAADARWSRIRTEGLALQAIANLRLGNEGAARIAYDTFTDATRATGAKLVTLVLNDDDHGALGGAARYGGVNMPEREVFPAVAARTKLTRQQRLMLDRLDSGATMRQIGTELHLSYNTVKTHIRALYARLDAASRDQALARAREEGLL